MPDDRYQLIDFGSGRKLESLAGHVVDRPSPAAADMVRRNPTAWRKADATYDNAIKRWIHHRPWPENLAIGCGDFRIPVGPTPHGHIGVFPEQSDNWRWLSSTSPPEHSEGQALNLFGYTGASTLALVYAGYSVAHVDAAKPNVQALRRATEFNHMLDPPIRFLVDDAAKFTAREVRRGRKYHTIVLDPPAYGHSPSGRAWRLERDLWPLLEDCRELLEPEACRLLVTGHSPEVTEADLVSYFERKGWNAAARIESGRSGLIDKSGRRLDTGFFVRWTVDSNSLPRPAGVSVEQGL